MQKNNILLLALRWNIIWDSVREISLAKKLLKENPNSKIIYPCGKIIFELFENNKYLTPIYIKELDNLSKTNISKIKKLFFLIKWFFEIIKNVNNLKTVIYSWSKVKIRQSLTKIISIIKKSNFLELWFENAKWINTELYFSKEKESNIKKYLKNNKKRNISICIESTDINRMWNKTNFKNLIEKLSKTYNIYLLWIDKECNNEIIEYFWDNIINLVWKLNITESSIIIKNSYYFIWNDSWLAHIASWVNTNIIVITLEQTINENMIFNNNNYTCNILQNPDINNILIKIK